MERAQDVGNDPEREREQEPDLGDAAPDDTVNAGQDRETNVEDDEPGFEDGGAG